MKTIYILVAESSVIQAIADPQYCFEAVNQFLVRGGQKPVFQVELVGIRSEISLTGGAIFVRPHRLLENTGTADLVILPALFGDLPNAIEANREALSWIVDQYRNGAEIASLCVGAFLLASTGLLNGKKCSTHWGFTGQFRRMFPQVLIQDGQIVTEEGGLYSSGGAHSYWNLLLHLVEKFTGREMAILISKYFAIDINRSSQSAFALFNGQKGHHDEAVKKAQEYIEKNVDEKISVDDLADKIAVGRRTFERRFKRATNNSVLEYIRRVKVEAAKRNIETGSKNITEVMFEVGYTDVKSFRAAFKQVTGLTPVEYRNKYNCKLS
ncbi:MAG: GlxA family transcriptional regulator [Mangrovibacterium sp.]